MNGTLWVERTNRWSSYILCTDCGQYSQTHTTSFDFKVEMQIYSDILQFPLKMHHNDLMLHHNHVPFRLFLKFIQTQRRVLKRYEASAVDDNVRAETWTTHTELCTATVRLLQVNSSMAGASQGLLQVIIRTTPWTAATQTGCELLREWVAALELNLLVWERNRSSLSCQTSRTQLYEEALLCVCYWPVRCCH